MISLCCHLSWEYEGRGRIGNGGVGTRSLVETANANEESKTNDVRHEERASLTIIGKMVVSRVRLFVPSAFVID